MHFTLFQIHHEPILRKPTDVLYYQPCSHQQVFHILDIHKTHQKSLSTYLHNTCNPVPVSFASSSVISPMHSKSSESSDIGMVFSKYCCPPIISTGGKSPETASFLLFKVSSQPTKPDIHTRACLKNHSCHLYVPFCAIFASNSVDVARYASFIWHKSPTNCDAHLTESIFQTRSSVKINATNLFISCTSSKLLFHQQKTNWDISVHSFIPFMVIPQ